MKKKILCFSSAEEHVLERFLSFVNFNEPEIQVYILTLGSKNEMANDKKIAVRTVVVK